MRHTTKISNLIFFICVIILSGCAGVPKMGPQAKERIISVGGKNYISLLDLVQSSDLDYEYDTFLQSITLSNGSHSLNFFIGKDSALYDGRVIRLSSASIIEQGELLIPLELRQEVIGSWLVEKRVSIEFPVTLDIRKVVVDPGHGGKDPGAIGRSGLREKDVVLDIAKNLREELKKNGIGVIMTRDSDVFIPLEKRSEIANNSDADLFISIHVNAHRDRSISGLEVYYLSNQIDDLQRAACSRSEPFPKKRILRFYRSAPQDLKTIVWDIIYTGNRRESVLVAKEIDNKIYNDTGLRPRGIKAARFAVLKNTRIPAVLAELGFISNSKEEQKLKSKSYRKSIAQSLARSINSHNHSLAKR